jgi:hypothetical protein
MMTIDAAGWSTDAPPGFLPSPYAEEGGHAAVFASPRWPTAGGVPITLSFCPTATLYEIETIIRIACGDAKYRKAALLVLHCPDLMILEAAVAFTARGIPGYRRVALDRLNGYSVADLYDDDENEAADAE